jgi:hypothetical protein
LIFTLRQLADANLSPYPDMPQYLLNRKNKILQKYETDLMEIICERPLSEITNIPDRGTTPLRRQAISKMKQKYGSKEDF